MSILAFVNACLAFAGEAGAWSVSAGITRVRRSRTDRARMDADATHTLDVQMCALLAAAALFSGMLSAVAETAAGQYIPAGEC